MPLIIRPNHLLNLLTRIFVHIHTRCVHIKSSCGSSYVLGFINNELIILNRPTMPNTEEGNILTWELSEEDSFPQPPHFPHEPYKNMAYIVAICIAALMSAVVLDKSGSSLSLRRSWSSRSRSLNWLVGCSPISFRERHTRQQCGRHRFPGSAHSSKFPTRVRMEKRTIIC